MSPFRPHPLPFTSKDPRMQDPKGESVSGPDEGLNDFSGSVLSCPVVVATEPAYALARQVKKVRQKRADAKAAEKGKATNNSRGEKLHGKPDEYDNSDSEEDGHVTPQSSQKQTNKHNDMLLDLSVCTPDCPGYKKDQCLAHERKQPRESTSSGSSAD
ncbi:hypothetical protein FSARC_9347 [Fusarium sarcochroum]|uniref:Uncharacterized protein n=1 Tax=Fusarium sarcochroum TaxID=1208366 RepID=A0A8H4X677_9HYPO|nr:hypothetical protein FSARC_9347 [Fusarium sarcochroum]